MVPNSMSWRLAVWMCLVAFTQTGVAADKPTVDEALAGITSYEFGQSREPLSVVEDMVRESMNSPRKGKGLTAKLSSLLTSDATPECKRFVCRQLAVLGSKESVPTLAALLLDEDLSDMARFALEGIDDPSAEQALLDGLNTSKGKIRVGIINSLGDRESQAAVAALAGLISNQDVISSDAAICSLGKIGGQQAAAALEKNKDKVPSQLHAAVMDAYLKCANRMAKDGEKAKAAIIYEAAFAADEPVMVHVAAFDGLVAVHGERSLNLVLRQLSSREPLLFGAALRAVTELPGDAATKAFVGQLPKLPPERQALLLQALAHRGDEAALPAVAAALASEDQSVKVAALQALGVLGNARAVTLLARAAASGTEAEQAAARASLAVLKGDTIDRKIVALLADQESEARAELAACLGPRNVHEAVSALLKTINDPDASVRLASLRALQSLGTEREFPALVSVLVKSSNDDERDESGKSLVAIAQRVSYPDQLIEVVTSALAEATDVDTKSRLIRVIAQIGGDRAVAAVHPYLQDTNPEIHAAAVQALADSADQAALPVLLEIAKSDDHPPHRSLALDAYIALLGPASFATPQEKFEAFRGAYALATRKEEKRKILYGLIRVRTLGSLNFVLNLLADEEVAEEAARAVVYLAEPGRRTDIPRDKANAALKRAIEVTKDQELRDRAKAALESGATR